jgi:hypothetical protein
MDEETEKRLHRVEVESAACYADMEDAAQRFWMLSEILDAEHEAGIPDSIEEEPSIAHHLSELSLRLKAD